MTLLELRRRLAEIGEKRARLRQQLERAYIELSNHADDENAEQLKATVESLRRKAAELRARSADGPARELDPRQFVAELDGAIPILLMPLRLQTRFDSTPNGNRLFIRAYPDDISIQSHEPRLTDAERATGDAFWAAPDDDEASVLPRKAHFRGLASRFGLHRAAWIIRSTEPGGAGSGSLELPLRVPAAWTLPERLVFRIYGEANQLLGEVLGTPIPDGLELGLDPTAPSLGFNRANGELTYPAELRWQSDIDAAIEVGMAVSVPLDQLGNPLRIARIVALGVHLAADEQQSSALLEELIEGHRYTDGFAILPQGAPTNSVSDQVEAERADADAALARLSGPGAYPIDPKATLYEDECDGLRLAHALGISPEILRYVDNAEQEDGREAIAMKRALWSGTLGYYCQQMLAPLLDGHDDPSHPERLILAARSFFTHFVYGRGPLAAIRVGSQPYGVLPVSADLLREGDAAEEPWGDGFFDSFLANLHAKMMILSPTWVELSGHVPHAGAGASANARLLDVLATQASSVEWHSERLVGPKYLDHYTDFKEPRIGSNTPYNQYLAQLTDRFEAADASFPGLFPLRPRAFELSFLGAFWRTIVGELDQQVKGLDRGPSPALTGDVIDHQPYSETRGIEPGYPNYIAWLSKASFDDVRRGLSRTGASNVPEPVTALLYMALRHSLLHEHAFLAMRLLSRFGTHPTRGGPYSWRDFAEKEIYNISFELDLTPWDHVRQVAAQGWPLGGAQPIPGSVLDLIQSREALRAQIPNWSAVFGDIEEVARAIRLFAEPAFPTARLERLFAEHMDLASYRLDAWATGFVYQRLLAQRVWREESRAGRPHPLRAPAAPGSPPRYDLSQQPLGRYSTGIYIGAYGWLENLRPGASPARVDALPAELASKNGKPVTRDPESHGFIHAPSLNQAVTAAVLRSASVTQPDTSAYNVDLSSTRTRNALWIIGGVRNGESPAALLGYRFERGLRERAPALQQWLPALRAAFPIPRPADTSPGPKETIVAHDVVNGLLLVQARRTGTLPGLIAFAGTGAAVMIGLADELLDMFDACGDLLLAESVHQASQGNYDRAGSMLTAAGEFSHIPEEFQVTQTPRSGTALSHRLLLAMTAPAVVGDGARSPRARLEPGLNQWLSNLIGPLAAISTKVIYRFEGGETEFVITYDRLELEPIDLLFVADARTESELHGRLELATRPEFEFAHPDTPILEIVVDTTSAAAAIVLLDSARVLLSSARPASRRDFVATSTLHGLAPSAVDGIDEDELVTRVLGVSRADADLREPSSLWFAFEALQAQLEQAELTPRARLLQAAEFGIPGALPGGGELSAQLDGIKALLAARHEAASAKWSPFVPPTKEVLRICREVTDILLGGAFPLMPRMLPVPDLAAAVLPSGNPAYGRVRDWLLQLSTVRPRVRALLDARVLASELGAGLASLRLIQWPTTNKDWIALPVADGATLSGDLVSIALQPVGAFDAALPLAALVVDEWTETIPSSKETTGISYHYDAPAAEPPQCILLAVSLRKRASDRRWTWEELEACVTQALELAKVRAVGPDELRSTRLDPLLPATLAAEATTPATISTSWFGNLLKEVAATQHELLRRS